jgi:hypothetical protein
VVERSVCGIISFSADEAKLKSSLLSVEGCVRQMEQIFPDSQIEEEMGVSGFMAQLLFFLSFVSALSCGLQATKEEREKSRKTARNTHKAENGRQEAEETRVGKEGT